MKSKLRLSKAILAILVIGFLGCGLFSPQAQAGGPVTGNITFGGLVSLDTASAGTATTVTAWHGLSTVPIAGAPQVQGADNSFAAFVTLGHGVLFHAPWVFNSGPIASFWSVDGFTFDLTTSAIIAQNANAVIVNGTGSVFGNGFNRTPGTWSFTTQNPEADSVFSFSAATGAVPEAGTVSLLITGAFGLAGMRFWRRKRNAS